MRWQKKRGSSRSGIETYLHLYEKKNVHLAFFQEQMVMTLPLLLLEHRISQALELIPPSH